MELVVPLKKWVKDELENRENNPLNGNIKTPYIVLSSVAKVVKMQPYSDNASEEEKAEKTKKILETTTEIPDVYRGCIISNHTNYDLQFSMDEVFIGYDFDGKKIYTENSKNKRIPPPIVESFTINSDFGGHNNTQKEGIIKVKCFSTKQFEMFEQFFCKFGMYILVEFGNQTKQTENNFLLPKNNYNTFITTFKSFLNSTEKFYFDYYKELKNSNGAYDRMAGIVRDYNYSMDETGVYEIQINIIQSNQITLLISLNYSNISKNIASPNSKNLNNFNEWVEALKSDLGLHPSFKLDKKIYQNDFFNWGKQNIQQSDQNTSHDEYISLRLILKELLNHSNKAANVSDDIFEFLLPKYIVDGKLEEYIPIKFHPNLISTNAAVIFPSSNFPQFDIENNSIGLSNKRIDGSINGYSIIENKKIELKYDEDENGDKTMEPNLKGEFVIGNALNIFLKYETIIRLWRNSSTKADFLVGLLSLINEISLNVFYLLYSNIRDGQKASIKDMNLYTPIIRDTNTYRFKPTEINSNVRAFSYNFKAPQVYASYTLFNRQIQLRQIFTKDAINNKILPLPKQFNQETKFYLNANADGYYSINQVEWEDIKRQAEKNNMGISYSPPKKQIDETKKESAKKELLKGMTYYSVKFKMAEDDYKVLIYRDSTIITRKLNPDSIVNKTNTSVTPITINITIDGMSGFSAGEYFNISGIPEIYNTLGVFRIKNVSHSIDVNKGWVTILDAVWMIKND
jgi:hypothetical protein